MIEWNDEQRAVLGAEGNILVSASAGSGKTAVMLERIMRVCRSVPVEKLAVLAFNDDIAAEIKEKLAVRLAEEAETTGSDFFAEQLDNLPFCDVGTFHKFCSKLIKEYFEYAGVDVSFSIMDEKERDAVFNKALREEFDERYDRRDADFMWLKSRIGGKREEELAETVKKIYDFAAARMDGDAWLDNAAQPYRSDKVLNAFVREKRAEAERTLKLGEAARSALSDALSNAKAEAADLSPKKGAAHIEKFEKYLEKFEAARADYGAFLKRVAQLFDADDYRDGAAGVKLTMNDFKGAGDACPAVSEYLSAAKELSADAARFGFADGGKIAAQGAKTVELLTRFVKSVKKRFDAFKKDENKLDFDDLEYYAVKALGFDEVADKVRDKYEYVYVDEYQDTNYVQEYIVNAVSRGNNLFAVGDSKQSIYRFRLSEPGILIERRRRYREGEGKAFALNYNYRSDKKILDFANEVFSAVMTEEFGGENYAEEARFKAGKNYVEVSDLPAVEIAFYKRPLQIKKRGGVYSVKEGESDGGFDEAYTEAVYIAEKISRLVGKAKLYNADDATARVARYSDIALLAVRRSKKVGDILKYLKSFGIPVDAEPLSKKETCFETDILVDLLRVLDNPRQDIPLAAALKNFGGLDESELLALRRAFPDEKFFYRCFEKACETDGFEKCVRFAEKCEKWRDTAGFCDVSELLRAVADDGYALKLRAEEGGAGKYARLYQFIQSLKGKRFAATVPEFLYACDKLEMKNELSAPSAAGRDCVKTSTVHHGKGLEFPVVFVLDASAAVGGGNFSVLCDNDWGMAVGYYDDETRTIKDSAQSDFLRRKKKKEEAEERLRLMYVALTRAKNHLFITGAATKDDKPKKPEKASSFMDWLRLIPNAPFVEIQPLCAEKTAEKRAFSFKPPDKNLEEAARAYIGFEYPYAESMRLSIKRTVTEINKQDERVGVYLPHVFAESTAERGSVYHKVLEHVDFGAKTEMEVAREIERMVAEGALDAKKAETVDCSIVAQCLGSPLIGYAAEHRHKREASFMLYLPADELGVSQARDKVLVQGTIDLLIFDGESAAVVDFKSSGLAPELLAKKYERQLALYKKAAEICYGFKKVDTYLYVLGQNVVIKV